MPSGEGTRSLMQNFWPETLTSGTTSQPGGRRDGLGGWGEEPGCEGPGWMPALHSGLGSEGIFRPLVGDRWEHSPGQSQVGQVRPLHTPGPALPLSRRPPSLTLEVELLDGFPGGLVLALVVGQGGLLEHHPVLAVPLQSQFPGPEGVVGGSGQATSLQQGCQGWTQAHRKIRRWSLSSGMVVRLSWGEEESGRAPSPCAQPWPQPLTGAPPHQHVRGRRPLQLHLQVAQGCIQVVQPWICARWFVHLPALGQLVDVVLEGARGQGWLSQQPICPTGLPRIQSFPWKTLPWAWPAPSPQGPPACPAPVGLQTPSSPPRCSQSLPAAGPTEPAHTTGSAALGLSGGRGRLGWLGDICPEHPMHPGPRKPPASARPVLCKLMEWFHMGSRPQPQPANPICPGRRRFLPSKPFCADIDYLSTVCPVWKNKAGAE